jgi:hypothetical protein
MYQWLSSQATGLITCTGNATVFGVSELQVSLTENVHLTV